MNISTLNYLERVEQIKQFYNENNSELDHVKCLNALMPMLTDLIKSCNKEFVDSIAYIHEYNQIKKQKKQKIEILSNRIRMAISDYYNMQRKKLSSEDDVFLTQNIQSFSDQEMLEHLETMNRLVKPIHGDLMQYGISAEMLREFNQLVHNLLPVVPLDLHEIEQHKKRYRAALRAMHEVELYLEYK